MAFVEVDAQFGELRDLLDIVLLEGIDWRPFNVHAALVNAALARAIREATAPGTRGRPLVFTGGLRGRIPRGLCPGGGRRRRPVPCRRSPRQPRRALVDGLDTSHREVGVFGAWELTTVQPYAAAADLYLSLPATFLGAADRKQRLSRDIFGPMLPRMFSSVRRPAPKSAAAAAASSAH